MLQVSYFGRAKVLVQDELGCFHGQVVQYNDSGSCLSPSIYQFQQPSTVSTLNLLITWNLGSSLVVGESGCLN